MTGKFSRCKKVLLPQRLDSAEQIFFARNSSDLITKLPVFEEEQSRDGPDVVLERKTLTFVHINFGDLNHAGFLMRDLIQQWRDHFARTTPFRPKIDDYRLLALHDFAVKIGLIEVDRGGIVHGVRKSKSKSE